MSRLAGNERVRSVKTKSGNLFYTKENEYFFTYKIIMDIK